MKVNIKKVFWIYLQKIKIHQQRIRSEISIWLEIILNVYKCFKVSSFVSLKFFDNYTSFSFVYFSWHPLWIAVLSDAYILLSLWEEEVYSSSWRDRCIYLAAHSLKILNPLSVTMLLCLGNTSRKQSCKVITLSLILLV